MDLSHGNFYKTTEEAETAIFQRTLLYMSPTNKKQFIRRESTPTNNIFLFVGTITDE